MEFKIVEKTGSKMEWFLQMYFIIQRKTVVGKKQKN